MSIRDFLLNKAIRDLSRLVRVQRIRHTKYGTQLVNMWVSPSQIKSTDKVVQNAHLVSQNNGAYVPAKGVWDSNYFSTIAQTDKKKAMEYAQSVGITWIRDKDEGKDWFRALQATKDFSKTYNQNIKTAQQATATNGLDQKIADEVNNEPSARGKVLLLTHYLGKDGLKAYAKQIGVSWKDVPNDDKLTWHHLRHALRRKFESGYQVVATVTPTQPTAQTAPTATPTPKATKAKATKAKTKAPKADKPKDVQPTSDTTAQDTPKVEPKKETEAPKLDESLIEIDPTKMTQREQNIANLLNKCTDAKTLEVFAKAGIVGEDDQATEFVKKQLYAGYYGDNIISDNFFERGKNYKTHDISLNAHLDSIGTKLKLSKNEVVREFLDVLDTGSSYSRYGNSTDFYKIIDPYINFDKSHPNSVRQGMHVMNNALLELNNASLKGSDKLSTILNRIETETPDLKDSAKYIASEYSKVKDVFGTSISALMDPSTVDSYLDEYDLPSMKLARRVFNEMERLKPLGDLEKFVDTFEAVRLKNTSDSAKVANYNTVLGSIRYDIPKDGLYLMYLAYKTKKDPMTLTRLPITEFNDLAKTYLSDNSGIRMSAVLAHAKATQEFKIHSEFTSPKAKEGIKHYLNVLGLEVYDQSTDKPVNIDELKTNDLFSVLKNAFNGTQYVNVTGPKLRVKQGLSKEMKTVQSNLVYSSRVLDALDRVQWSLRSKKRDLQSIFSFDRYSDDFYKKVSLISTKDRDSIIATAQKVSNEEIEKQINKNGLKDPKQIEKYKEYIASESETLISTLKGMGFLSSDNISSLAPETKKLFVNSMQILASYSVKLNTNKKYNTDDKRIKYVDEVIGNTEKIEEPLLKELREQALSKCNCTLATADQATYDSVDHKVKQDWDKGKLGESGRRLYGHISFVNHGVYQINNSVAEDRFNSAVQELNKKGDYNGTPNNQRSDKKYFDKTVRSLYHGTNFKGGCGILGVDGKFRDYREAQAIGQKTAGAMLGNGTYLADLAGKSAGYFGDWGKGYGKRGALLICDAVLGNHHEGEDRFQVNRDYNSDSVSLKEGSISNGRRLRADEWCVRNPSLVFPRMIIDAESKPR